MPQGSGKLEVAFKDSFEKFERIAYAVRFILDAKHFFRWVENRSHTERVQHMEYAVHVRYGITYQGKHECKSPKALSLMQPVKHAVCHSVKEKTTGHERCKCNCPVGISHVAAPVHEDKRAEHHDDEQLACAEGHGHAPTETLHKAVFLLVEAEEYCQNNEGKEILNELESLYHTLVFV